MANEVNRIAELLLDTWKKADPKSSVALHPTSYVATFADMAKAIIEDRNTRPAAPVDGLERYDLGYIGPDGFTLPYKDGEYVRFDQAEAIIAAERADHEHTRELLNAAVDDYNRALTDNVAKHNSIVELEARDV